MLEMKLMQLNIQLFAHKKGQGSTQNGRDSESKRLGAKAADGEFITAGSIIYRQRGTKILVWEKIIHYLPKWMDMLDLNVRVETKNKLVFI